MYITCRKNFFCIIFTLKSRLSDSENNKKEPVYRRSVYSITTVYNIVTDDTDGDSVNNSYITILLLSYQAPITEKKRPSKLVFLIGLSSMFSGQSTHFNHIHVIISISWMNT